MKDDYISRRAIFHELLVIGNGRVVLDYDIDGFQNKIDVRTIKSIIRKTSASDVLEMKHGEWIYGTPNAAGFFPVQCSCCGTEIATTESPTEWRNNPYHSYCGACGAKMDGGENDDH